jgi:hypothetical protein
MTQIRQINLERHQAQLFTLSKNRLLALFPVQRIFPFVFILRPVLQGLQLVLREFHHVNLTRVDESFESTFKGGETVLSLTRG